ncbi:MAG TPA: 6-hydroxymethylpterin diphosphokinase MptE-like protein [Anaerolineales bacterium]|nr:6-hydroxymethylpterin diphosphokinase MptE-like protein [Anaerolineales bacterium]
MKQSIENLLPSPILRTVKNTYDAIRRLPQVPDAYMHPWRRESRARMRQYYNIHEDKRCFIIGNGPSLKQTDLTKLKGEFTFGMNRIYLLFPELGFTTTYFASINDLVIEQCAQEIAALPIPKFIAWHSNCHFQRFPDDMVFLYTTYTGPKFAYDMTGRIWEGATVTNVALQLAFYMGFEKVILIGVDHNFASRGDANKTVVSTGDDPNHFDPRYFGKGFRWQLPDLATSEIGYQMAREHYQKAGREVLDATVGGKLTVFPKVDYNSLF